MSTKHIEKRLLKTKKSKKQKPKRKIDVRKNDFDRDYLKRFDVMDKKQKDIDKELDRITKEL